MFVKPMILNGDDPIHEIRGNLVDVDEQATLTLAAEQAGYLQGLQFTESQISIRSANL
jgi:hypothetical protein